MKLVQVTRTFRPRRGENSSTLNISDTPSGPKLVQPMDFAASKLQPSAVSDSLAALHAANSAAALMNASPARAVTLHQTTSISVAPVSLRNDVEAALPASEGEAVPRTAQALQLGLQIPPEKTPVRDGAPRNHVATPQGGAWQSGALASAQMPTSTGTAGLLRLPAVMALTGLSRSTLYAAIKRGAFPRQAKILSGGTLVGWCAVEIEKWTADRLAARSLENQYSLNFRLRNDESGAKHG